MKLQASFIDFNHIAILVLLLNFVAFPTSSYPQNNKPVVSNSPKPADSNQTTDTQDDVIRIDSNLVIVPATVLDREGRYITNLHKEDFQIFENGIEQNVAFFEPTEQPFTILFLLDTSGSMTSNMSQLARAANAFVSQLRSDDQLIAASFCDYTKVLQKATKVSEIRKNFKIKLGVCGRGTMLHDAVDFSLKYLKKIHGRKAIVLLSDGLDSENSAINSRISATAKDNLRDAEEFDALIYTVQFGTFPDIPPSYVNKKAFYKSVAATNGYMRDLAEKTGGRRYQIEDVVDLEKTFGLVADELGRQYSLGYYPKATGREGERRQIKVKVNMPNVAVRARDSYIVGNSKKAGQK